MPALGVTWTDVITSVEAFLANTLVIGAITATMALIFAPRFLSAVKRILGRR